MKFSFIFSLILVSCVSFIQAQDISFDSKAHNFGTIYSEDGKVMHSFTFTNTGDKPLIISRVKAGCGCTTTAYTEDSVASGETGFITVQFNPDGYSSNFKKTVTVYSNAQKNPSVVLYIQGVVTTRNADLVKQYRYKKGALRFNKAGLNYGSVDINSEVTDTLLVYNEQDTAVSYSFNNIPDHVTVTYKPGNTLQSHEEGYIVCTYNAKKKNDFGRVRDIIRIKYKGEPYNYRHRVILSARLIEDFSDYSKWQLRRAPQIEFDTTVYNFDTVKQGTNVSTVFRFKNVGKKDLKIRKISTSCGCTAGDMEKKVYQKNETGEVHVTFRTRGKRKNQHQRITIITNDPTNQTVYLYIKGYVERND
ncbi:MAG: DUF1573 domain-containing protein [Bacteroidales bacterium]